MKMLTLVFGFALSLNAVAQNAMNAHLFRFSDTLETVQVEDALGANSELAQYKGLVRAHFDHAMNAFTGINDNKNPDSKLDSVSLGAAFMVSKKFLVSVTLPYHTKFAAATTSGYDSALGDMQVQAKWRLTNDSAWLNFALIPYLTIGTGSENDGFLTDGLGGGLKIALDKTFGTLKLFFNTGYSYHHDAYVTAVGSRREVVEAALGMFWAFTKPVGLNVEVIGQKSISKENDNTSPYVARVGLRGSFGRVKAFAGVSVDNTVYALKEQVLSYYAGVKLGLGSVAPAVVAAAPVVAAPAVVEKAADVVKQNLSLERVIKFKTGSNVLLASSHADLDSAAAIITKYQDAVGPISIEGHTDSVGSAKANKTLSTKRAEAVKAYLVSKGVKAEKLNAVGFGEEKLKVSPEKTKADKESNRRVEFKLIESI